VTFPSPGIYDGISELEYHGAKQLLGSTNLISLKQGVEAAWYSRFGPSNTQIDKEHFGKAVHCALGEGYEEFKKRFHVRPQTKTGRAVASNTAEYKEWAKCLTPGSYGITKKTATAVEWVVENALNGGGIVTEMLSQISAAERTYVARCPDTNLKLKARPDALCEASGTILEFKTSSGWQENKFGYSIRDFNYDLQAVYYRRVISLQEPGKWKRHIFIVIAKDPPYQIRTYELGTKTIEDAYSDIKELLRQYATLPKNSDKAAWVQEDKVQVIERARSWVEE